MIEPLKQLYHNALPAVSTRTLLDLALPIVNSDRQRRGKCTQNNEGRK
jgi:hypothetical protein